MFSSACVARCSNEVHIGFWLTQEFELIYISYLDDQQSKRVSVWKQNHFNWVFVLGWITVQFRFWQDCLIHAPTSRSISAVKKKLYAFYKYNNINSQVLKKRKQNWDMKEFPRVPSLKLREKLEINWCKNRPFFDHMEYWSLYTISDVTTPITTGATWSYSI